MSGFHWANNLHIGGVIVPATNEIVFLAEGNDQRDQDGNTMLKKMPNDQVGVFHNTGGIWGDVPVETFD